jgi:hypothetical protein
MYAFNLFFVIRCLVTIWSCLSYFQIVAFVLEAFFAEMELEKAGEADTQVRRVYLLKTNYHYSTQKTGVSQ